MQIRAHGMDGRSRNRAGARCIQRIVQEKPTALPADAIAANDEPADDRALAARVRSGQHGAFGQLMQRFDRHLFRIARGVVHDDTEAEDVVQEAYARAYHKLDTFRGDAPLRTWLTSILLNEARSRLRKRRSMVGLEQIDESSLDPYWATQASTRFGSEDPAALAAHAEIRRLIERAVDALPDAFRTVYVLREIEECSVEETASRLALKPETVKTRLHRARRMLRTSLHETLATNLTGTFPFMGRRCADMTTVLMAWLAVEATRGNNGK